MNEATAEFDDSEPDLSRALQVVVEEKTAAIILRAMRGEEQLDAAESLTYHVRLVLDNDQSLYGQRRNIVRAHLASREECEFCDGGRRDYRDLGPANICDCCGGSGERHRYPHQLGERLKGWCEELGGLEVDENDRLSILAREVLSTALAWADWTGLAKTYIREEQEDDHDG
jgi:hypothetical protein